MKAALTAPLLENGPCLVNQGKVAVRYFVEDSGVVD